jgi:hypothetical protein
MARLRWWIAAVGCGLVMEVVTMRVRYARLGALCGVFFVVALWVGNELATAGAGSMNDGPSVLAGVQRHLTVGNAVGMALELLGFAAFVFFLGYLRERLRGAGDWLAGAAVVAAAVTVAIKVGSVAPVYADRLDAHRISGELALALYDIANGAFVISGLTFAIFVVAAALAGLSAAGRAMPRWLCWSGLVVGLPGLVTPILGLISPGTYNALPWLAQLLWTLALGIAWTVRASGVGAPVSVSGQAAAPGVVLTGPAAGA